MRNDNINRSPKKANRINQHHSWSIFAFSTPKLISSLSPPPPPLQLTTVSELQLRTKRLMSALTVSLSLRPYVLYLTWRMCGLFCLQKEGYFILKFINTTREDS